MGNLHDLITAAWLTEVLHNEEHLRRGDVVVIHDLRMQEYGNSVHAHIHATYSDGPGPLPERFLLKLTKPHIPAAARREVKFYAEIAPLLIDLPLVKAYGTGMLEDGSGFVLLEDLSATHVMREMGLREAELVAMVDILAGLHAQCWEHPDVLRILPNRAQETFDGLFFDPPQQHANALRILGDHLSDDERHLLQRYYAAAPALLAARLQEGSALTFCHPDNIASNFLLPRQADGLIYLIDWHSYRIWWGGVDLAALITRTALVEHPNIADRLLRHYYDALRRFGVTRYSWEQCVDDYRLGVIDTLRMFAGSQSYGEWTHRNIGPLIAEYHRVGCDTLMG